MQPLFTNDAVVLGLLLGALALVFYTSQLKHSFFQHFYRFVPALLLCYFLPALLHHPLHWIGNQWFTPQIIPFALQHGIQISPDASFAQISNLLEAHHIDPAAYQPFVQQSKLYLMASRYLLPASLILLCLGIDFKGIVALGPKALLLFLTGTLGVIFGAPVSLWLVSTIAPNAIAIPPDDLWRGLSTIAGSWIGGGANQTALKEVFDVKNNIFAMMIIVDVVVANIWMGLLLYGAGISQKIDRWLNADSTYIAQLTQRMDAYQQSVQRIPQTYDLLILMALAFGGVAISHWGADAIVAWLNPFRPQLEAVNLGSIVSSFFWIAVLSTTIGLALSFTKARRLEGIGASNWGSVFIYILVATIGMQINLAEVAQLGGLFAVALVWMTCHAILLLIVAKIAKAPFFYLAVGSQANIGGAASAPIVAAAFHPSLASVGVLLAVLGYALGTYGGIVAAYLLRAVAL